jgi:hypothetical protein
VNAAICDCSTNAKNGFEGRFEVYLQQTTATSTSFPTLVGGESGTSAPLLCFLPVLFSCQHALTVPYSNAYSGEEDAKAVSRLHRFAPARETFDLASLLEHI